MSTLATLRALHATIGSALDNIETAYNGKGLDFPSPNVPLYRNDNLAAGFTADDPAEKLMADPAVARAASFAVAASGQLINTLQHPFFNLLEAATSYYVSAGIQFLEESHAPEIMRAAGPGGLHTNELAQKIDEVRAGKGPVSKPFDPSPLSHIFRLLATHQIVREVRPDVFANGRISALLDSGKTPEQIRIAPEKKYDDTNGVPAIIPTTINEGFRSVSYLSEWLLNPREGSNASSAFKYAYNTDEDMYKWLERPENALRLRQVGRGMAASSLAEGSTTVAENSAFPWDSLPKDAVVVDVGGGIGSVTFRIAAAHTHLRHIVQDRERTIAIAPNVWDDQQKKVFSSGRVAFQAQDFFAPQPTAYQVPEVGEVKHASVFVLTRVMHNWGDEDCKRILGHLRAAAGPDTKLLIVEQVLPLACAEEASVAIPQGSLAPANSPLLPNLGKAYAAGYHADMLMYAVLGGKERTLREMSEITSAAGWKIANLKRAEGGLWAYNTLVPV
ncbi:S-adenosyl-L-methionine-dependent methyltransferase [Ganoderma leucocontextum]|nr:S-adenosyl-L-methionine-dependent methyltransferase [Ganoderma leucocontextum]